MSGFENLGLMPVINAKGTATRLSGMPIRAEVRDAMAEAMTVCFDMVQLQARASEIISRHTGAGAGIVTSGAAAGLLLGSAAVIARNNPARMAMLPEHPGHEPEIIMARSQRNQYDHALRTTGARLIEVGLPDRYAGAGCRDAEPWEYEAAINARTALIFYVADIASRPSLRAVVEVAKKHGLPVLVDAAAELPPAGNLKRFIEEGADLVAFSGGKAIGGPQASGILCGNSELIASAALQMLDMDYPDDGFTPPDGFIDTGTLAGLPPHGIGRPCKVGKEQIIGLLTALDLFVREGDQARFERWQGLLSNIAAAIGSSPIMMAEMRADGPLPLLVLQTSGKEVAARQLYQSLIQASPAIHLDPIEIEHGRLIINPMSLLPEDASPLAEAILEACQQLH